MNPPTATRIRHAGAWAVTAVVLGAVFMMYLQPDFMVTLAQQVWACF